MQQPILSPEEFISEVEQALPKCTPTEANRLVEYAKVWAIDRYNGEVPFGLVRRQERLEAQCRTLTMRSAG
jgi:hypothetical protein